MCRMEWGPVHEIQHSYHIPWEWIVERIILWIRDTGCWKCLRPNWIGERIILWLLDTGRWKQCNCSWYQH